MSRCHRSLRHRSHESRREILARRIAQLLEEIAGLGLMIESQDRQPELIEQEIENAEMLVGRGLEWLPRSLALQRSEADISVEQATGETELQILDLDTRRDDDATDQLSQVRAELGEVTELLRASQDILARAVVTAPISGVVVHLRFHTLSVVVGLGEPILDIVPESEDLLIEARMAPTDIDSVTPGQPAQVHLTAYRQRSLPRIDGRPRHVSGDRLVDQATGQPYIFARVEVDRESLAAIAPENDLVPGMPAEVLILTGERTVLRYRPPQLEQPLCRDREA